jgi:hypothetical protein
MRFRRSLSGPKCYGGLEDIQVLVFDGRFDRILRGEADQDTTSDEMAPLRAYLTTDELWYTWASDHTSDDRGGRL